MEGQRLRALSSRQPAGIDRYVAYTLASQKMVLESELDLWPLITDLSPLAIAMVTLPCRCSPPEDAPL